MLRRCSAIGFLADIKICKGILLIHVTLLLSKLDIVLRISCLMQGDIRNECTRDYTGIS